MELRGHSGSLFHGILPTSSDESQLFWASNQEKRDGTRDKSRRRKGIV